MARHSRTARAGCGRALPHPSWRHSLPTIVKKSFPGHEIRRPAIGESPFVFASPHSGRAYPESFLKDAALSLLDMRRCEDAYVDALLPDPDRTGIPLLAAHFPRAFVDVNRNPRELDAAMFQAPPADGREIRTNRVIAGYGVIPRLASAGRRIYARKLPVRVSEERLHKCYRPYHAALSGLLGAAKARFGTVTLIDWHSMPSIGGNGQPLPDIVLGDRFGTSCGPEICARWADALTGTGLTVRRNTPYAGGYVTDLYGRPEDGVHVLQVEINRALYLDEDRVARKPAAWAALRDRLADAIGQATGSASGAFLEAAE